MNDIIQKADFALKFDTRINSIRETSVAQVSWASLFFRLDKVKKKIYYPETAFHNLLIDI